MKQAKQASEKELSEGYEIVPMTKPTCQPRQNARLYGEIVNVEDDEIEKEGYED